MDANKKTLQAYCWKNVELTVILPKDLTSALQWVDRFYLKLKWAGYLLAKPDKGNKIKTNIVGPQLKFEELFTCCKTIFVWGCTPSTTSTTTIAPSQSLTAVETSLKENKNSWWIKCPGGEIFDDLWGHRLKSLKFTSPNTSQERFNGLKEANKSTGFYLEKSTCPGESIKLIKYSFWSTIASKDIALLFIVIPRSCSSGLLSRYRSWPASLII